MQRPQELRLRIQAQTRVAERLRAPPCRVRSSSAGLPPPTGRGPRISVRMRVVGCRIPRQPRGAQLGGDQGAGRLGGEQQAQAAARGLASSAVALPRELGERGVEPVGNAARPAGVRRHRRAVVLRRRRVRGRRVPLRRAARSAPARGDVGAVAEDRVAEPQVVAPGDPHARREQGAVPGGGVAPHPPRRVRRARAPRPTPARPRPPARSARPRSPSRIQQQRRPRAPSAPRPRTIQAGRGVSGRAGGHGGSSRAGPSTRSPRHPPACSTAAAPTRR